MCVCVCVCVCVCEDDQLHMYFFDVYVIIYLFFYYYYLFFFLIYNSPSRLGSNASVDLPKFEFVVEGQLLVGKLKDRLEESERSLEGVVEVEYLEKLPPPTPKDSLHHDDWVAAVHASDQW